MTAIAGGPIRPRSRMSLLIWSMSVTLAGGNQWFGQQMWPPPCEVGSAKCFHSQVQTEVLVGGGGGGGTRVSKVAAINYMQEDTFLPQALFPVCKQNHGGGGEKGEGERRRRGLVWVRAFCFTSWVDKFVPPTHPPIPRMCSCGRTSVSWREG